MENLQKTTTGSLFNHTGILTHVGSYAGEYMSEAFQLIRKLDKAKLKSHGGDNWADIMVNTSTGKVYAVWAEGELTAQNNDVLYTEIEKTDCPGAWVDAQSKIEENA